MALFLAQKHILLGVTGSIAAYKSADLIRRLREAGAVVRVVMTANAKRFITPLTLQAVSGHPIHDDLFDLQAEAAMGHIELARWADMIVVAPATADFMARFAEGRADDLLTAVCLAAPVAVAIAPAMNQGMWKDTLTQMHLQALLQKHVYLLGPAQGLQACGDDGPGRLLEPSEIVLKISELFSNQALSGARILLTAGPTREAIDPVRFLSNKSSGKMGYALAAAAREAGAHVTLISGPVHLPSPEGVQVIAVESGQEMYEEAMRKAPECDIFLAVAAVSDYRPEVSAEQKIHKTASALSITLVPNPDIVSAIAQLNPKPFIVGFAAETEQVLERAQVKRRHKKMDMIIANQVGFGVGMESEENQVTIISEEKIISLPQLPKRQLATQLIDFIAHEYKQRKP